MILICSDLPSTRSSQTLPHFPLAFLRNQRAQPFSLAHDSPPGIPPTTTHPPTHTGRHGRQIIRGDTDPTFPLVDLQDIDGDSDTGQT